MPDLRLLTSSDEAIVLELRVPDWEVRPQKAGELRLDEISVPGFSHAADPGKPRLPVKFVTLGIPPGVRPQVQVLEADGLRIEIGYRLAENPSPSLSFESQQRLIWPNLDWQIQPGIGGISLDSVPQPSDLATQREQGMQLPVAKLSGPPEPQVRLASGDDFYPQELAQIVEVGRLRSQPFAQLRLNPFQYHPQKQTLRVYTRLRVAVTFDPPGQDLRSLRPTGWHDFGSPDPELRTQPEETARFDSASVDEGPFEPVLRSLLLNYAEAQAWRVPPGPLTRVSPQDFYTGIRYRIEISQNGLYELDRVLLPDTDIADYALSTFQLFEDFNLSPESEVALEVVDQDGDDRFDPGDVIRFYGRTPDEEERRYTGTRVYWLVAGREPGKHMATRSAPPGSGVIAPNFPTTAHAEENHVYFWNLPELGGSDTHWYWSYVIHTDPDTPLQRDFTVSTPGLSSSSHDVTLRAKLVGFSSNPGVDPDHHVKLYLGDGVTNNLIADTTWDGQRGIAIEAAGIASSMLNSGPNTVRLEVHLLPDLVADALFVDWFEIDYRRAFSAQNDRLTFAAPAGYSEYWITGFSSSDVGVYDITDPQNPVRLSDTQTTGWGWLRFHDETPGAEKYIAVVLQKPALLEPDSVTRTDAVTDLRAPGTGAEYLIVTHADFTDAADRLAAHRASDFTVRVVQVQDVYNQFGNAVLDPEAIHDFLAYAVDNWSPHPQYVLLMGDGTYDYRDYLGGPRQNFIPPYLAMVDPWLGETADENYYAAVSGPDIVPDLFVGRLPVNTLDEANAVVDKIIGYEETLKVSKTFRVSDSVLFVADDYEPARNAGNFPRMADAMASDTLPDSYTVQKVYYGETHATVGEVRSAIVSNINQGQRFVNYIGHSSVGQWADEGFFATSDVEGLNNAGKFPVILGLTCLEGSFQDAAQDALAERIVRAPNRGAVASWSATGLGVATGHDDLGRGFYNALFQDGVRRVGPAAVGGKVQLYNTGVNLDLIHTFALLGDPATNTGIEDPCIPSQADITDDGRVDINDLAELSLYWRQYYAPYDQDGNNFINIVDLMLVAAAWNSGCGG